MHFIPAADAINYCRAHNDDLASIVAGHPDRFVGLASLPMQDIDAAIAELDRCVNELGLLGSYTGTDFGIHLDDAKLDPFFEACVELDVPWFLHPAPTGLDGPLRDDRMTRFSLELVAEFSLEEMLAVAMLVFGGVSRRHPDLDICISHGGGSFPMHRPRSKLASVVVPDGSRSPGLRRAVDAVVRCQRAPSSRLWLNSLARAACLRHRLGGCDGGTTDHVDDLTNTLNYNAARLLRLDKRAPHLVVGHAQA